MSLCILTESRCFPLKAFELVGIYRLFYRIETVAELVVISMKKKNENTKLEYKCIS